MVTFTITAFDDRTEYRLDGKLHSLNDNIPAAEYRNGKKLWYKNGEKIDPPSTLCEDPNEIITQSSDKFDI